MNTDENVFEFGIHSFHFTDEINETNENIEE
jgi:hypothetical protein